MASATRVTARLQRAGLASIRRSISTAHSRHQQWSSATSKWNQNVDSATLKTLKNGESFFPFNELILSHNFYSADTSATVQTLEETQAASGEDENSEEDTLPELNKTNETPDKKKWSLEDARREICKVLNKGDEDMEETLTQLGVKMIPRLVKLVMVKSSSPSSVLRFFQWAKLQPGFKHNTSTYDELVNILGRSKDFETLHMILAEMLSARCHYSVKTFSFATVWHDDSSMLNNVIEMIGKLDLVPKTNAYEMLIAALCEENHANAALGVLEKMASADCAPRVVTFRPQYADLFRTQQVTAVSNFRIDWKTFDIAKKSFQVKLGIPVGTKRHPVYDDNNVWVDTNPKEVFDFGGLSILKYQNKIVKAQLDNQDNEYAHRIRNLEVENERNKTEFGQRLAMLESELAKLWAKLDKKDNESASSADHKVMKMEEYNSMMSEAIQSDEQISDLKKQLDNKDTEYALVTFRPLIMLFCLKDQLDKVQLVFEMMKMKGCPPDSITYNLVLSKLCYRKRLAEAVELLESMVDSGCKPDALTYDVMIYDACKTTRVEGALELFNRMKEEGIKPLYGTYAYLLNGIFEARGFNEVHSFLIQQSGTDPYLDSGNYEYLIRICHKSGLQKEVHNLLTEMKAKDLKLLDDNLFNDILHENDASQAT